MENETKNQASDLLNEASDYPELSLMDKNSSTAKPSKKDYFLPASILIAAVVISGTWIYTAGSRSVQSQNQTESQSQVESAASVLEEKVLPAKGVTLPVSWGDLGKKMVASGVIDKIAFEALYANRGGLTADMKSLLDFGDNGQIVMTPQNAGVLLNLFWALGLSNKNSILESGPMQNPQYGGAANFASTGGWTLAKGNVMTHYSAHQFMTLTADEQKLVEGVAKGIYRPCCGNSVYFPDCNHGMAMLGLLELMASQGVDEQDLWKVALAVNSYWFPDTYLTIATYMKNKGVDWQDVNSQEMLGANYSSAQGYAKIASQVTAPQSSQGGSGCAVDTGQSAPASQKQPASLTRERGEQSGCGI